MELFEFIATFKTDTQLVRCLKRRGVIIAKAVYPP